ncbi:autotransporter outer membrane beta-barrel domain-containing protein [Brucella sp. 21LCYQ03]|nr:autotransporter outer membrane beta-barrel domain-containing protein [Brucella sp. 21LCYQ03]
MLNISAKHFLAISSLIFFESFAHADNIYPFDVGSTVCVKAVGAQPGTQAPGGCSDNINGSQGGGSENGEGSQSTVYEYGHHTGMIGGKGADASSSVKGGAGGIPQQGNQISQGDGEPGESGGDYGAGGGGGSTAIYITDGSVESLIQGNNVVGGAGGAGGAGVLGGGGGGGGGNGVVYIPKEGKSNTLYLGAGIYKGGEGGAGGKGQVPGQAGASGDAIILGGTVPMTATFAAHQDHGYAFNTIGGKAAPGRQGGDGIVLLGNVTMTLYSNQAMTNINAGPGVEASLNGGRAIYISGDNNKFFLFKNPNADKYLEHNIYADSSKVAILINGNNNYLDVQGKIFSGGNKVEVRGDNNTLGLKDFYKNNLYDSGDKYNFLADGSKNTIQLNGDDNSFDLKYTAPNLMKGFAAFNKVDKNKTWTVTGNQQNDMAWQVQEGQLILSGDANVEMSKSMTVVAGAKLDMGDVTADGLTFQQLFGGGIITAGHKAITISKGGDFSGRIDTGADLTLTGGMLTLGGANAYAGDTHLNGGVLSVADAGYTGIATNKLFFDGGTLQITGTTFKSTDKVINWEAQGGGFDIADSGNTFTVDQKLSAGGSLTKLGAGTLVLSGDNLYKGGTYLNGGTLQVASDANLGDASGALNFDTGTLHLTNTMNSSRAVLLTSHGGTISVDANKTATFGGIFKNALKATGSLTKSGDGTLIMTAANTYTGGTTVSGGILQLGDGVTDGSITNAIALNGGNLVVDNIGATALASVISGTGSLTQNGAGTLTLSGNNGYSGGTSLNAGVISAEQDENLGTGPLNFDGGTLQIMGTHFTNTTKQIVWGAHGGSFDIDDANNHFALSNVFTGSGALTKTGAGTLALTGDSSGYQGNTTVSQGSLRLDGGKLGNGAGAVHVASGGSLGGHGTIGDTTDIATGGTLFAQSGQKLTFDKDLTLNTGSIVSVDLGAPNASGLFDVKGNLTLAGTLNITDAGGFGPGRYRIFEYGGTLTDNTLSLGTVPNGDTGWSILTSTPHQVNLVNSAGAILSFWDGQDTSKHDNNLVDGGDGTWDASNANWTDQDGSFNKKWDNNQFAIFEGTAGTVTVATNFKPTVKGLQFFVDGYTVTGGAITLGGADNQINVGDGTQDSASYVATIASVLEGQNGFTKVNYGTLNLTGQNIYSGTTTVKDGTLELSGNGSIANSAEIVLASSRFGQSGLLINKDQDFNLANKVSGIGAVTKDGNSTTTFAGNNTFSGGLTVKGGTAKAGIADNAFGSGNVMVNGGARLDLANLNQSVGSLLGGKTGDGAINLGSGTLTLNQNLHGDFSGKISGTGGITKTNDGDLVLYGANDYSGVTAINEGALVQGAAGGFSSASTFNVASGASLQLEGFATNMAGLSNAGNVFFGGINATVLNVSGDYNGNGGTLHMSAVFGDDNSVADRLNVGGSTSGSTHIDITNRDGFGAKTNNGIEIVSVGGNSLGAFTLNGDYVTKDGQQAIMTNTAYAYTLQKGGTNTPNDGNWYLVSSNNTPVPPVDPDCQTTNTCPTPPAPGPNPDPAPGRYSAAAPVYESYTSTLQALNALPTLQQRVGQRYLGGADQAGSGASSGARSGESDNKAIWGRIEGAHNRQENRSTAGDLHQDINTLIMQAGVDGQFYENENGKLFAGITGQYGNARSDVDNRTGDGSGTIDTQGWGLGATATWYGTSGFYLDGQAQVNWYDSDLDVDAANPTLKNGNKGIGYALSIEAGQRFAMNQNWSLTPQAQLMWSSVDFDTFSDTYGARISNRSSDSLTARLGLAANYANSWKGNDGRMVNTSLYGIANLYQELMGDARINYAGTHMATDSDDTWGGIGAGGAYAWADGKYVFYGEGSVGTALNHFADSYKIKGNIGFKVNW